MILTIDVGNSTTVIGCFDGQTSRMRERVSTDVRRTELEYEILIKHALESNAIKCETIEGGILSSVVPPVTESLRRGAERLIRAPIKVVGPGLKTGLNILIDDPGALGSDLLTASVAAAEEHALPLIARIEAEIGKACTVIATGPYAERMVLYCMREIEIDSDLMLKGLRILYERNDRPEGRQSVR